MQSDGKRLVVGIVVAFVLTLFVILVAQAAKGGGKPGNTTTPDPAIVMGGVESGKDQDRDGGAE